MNKRVPSVRQQSAPHRSAQPRLLLSAITVAVLTLAGQAQAQSDAPMTRVEVTGSSIKRLAAEAALPVSTLKAEDLTKAGMTTLADVMMAPARMRADSNTRIS